MTIQHTGSRRQRTAAVLLVSLAVISWSGSCSAGSTGTNHGPGAATSSAPPGVGTPKPEDDAVAAALAAYTSLWHAYTQAVHHPDPTASALVPYATGPALATFQHGLAWLNRQGLTGEGDVVLGPPQITSATTSTVSMSDCVDDAQTRLFKVDGSAYQDTAGGKRWCTIAVTNIDGVWKVSEWTLRAVGTC